MYVCMYVGVHALIDGFLLMYVGMCVVRSLVSLYGWRYAGMACMRCLGRS